MSVDRYNRLVAYLNSPERVTLWEHRRLSNPYLWGRDETREPVRSIVSLRGRILRLLVAHTYPIGSKTRHRMSDFYRAAEALSLSRRLAGLSSDRLAPTDAATEIGRFIDRWRSPSGLDASCLAFGDHAQRAIETKRFPTFGAFYAELWHRLKSTFAFHDAPWCEFEDLPPEFSALIRTRNVSADATDQLRRAIDRHGPLTIRTSTDDHTVTIGPPEGWLEASFEHQHIEGHGFEVD